MTLPQAWMQQAESGYRAALRLDNPPDARTRCQAISKYQQCVEKSVKAVLDKLYSAGLIRSGSDRSHKVSRYASVLTSIPATTRDSRDLFQQMQRIFTSSVVEQIRILDSLVPEYPVTGALARRNHEYPFQDPTGNWHAPSELNAFTLGELKRIRNCAGALIQSLRRILDALDRLFP
jgi:predicted transcriptional regulator